MPLRQLYPDPEATETHASPTVIDIIAVPGLGPPVKGEAKHAFDTWRTPSGQKGRLWLQHDLPDHIPDSRIFLYQYNTTAAYGQGLEDFRSKADNLLEVINIEKRDCPDRPILLLGHSMGGLLIKQALINAHSNPGTAIAIELGHGIRDDLVRTLQAGSIFSELESWKHQALQYDTVSFWGSSDTIVTSNNVSLGLPGDVAKIVELDANHRGICKFSNSKKDQYNFKIVVENIKRLCELAIENPQTQGAWVPDTSGVETPRTSENDGQDARHDMLEEIQRVALSMNNETEQLIMTPSQESHLQDDEVIVQESLTSTSSGHSTTKYAPVFARSAVQDLHMADIPAVESQNKLYSQMPFELLISQEPILQGIRYLNYQKPTIVQEAVLSALTLCPPRNVIASYPPRTGRTTALAIALLSPLDYHLTTQPQALVMVATQLLVRQTEKCIKEVGRSCEGPVVETITASSRPTAKVEANVIIATPGTLLDCIRRRLVDMSQVRYLLMDDVDHVVDIQGLSDQCLRVTAVAQKSPETVQLLIFSDLTTPASKFLNVMLRSNTLEKLELKGVELNANKIVHLVFRCSGEQQKLEIICKLPGVVTTSVLIIFVQTKASASHIHIALAAEGHAVANLFEADYSDYMEALLKRFQSGEFKVLITKDYKTRGLDLPSSSMVINYDTPDADACQYLRQVSRAGKVGRSGFAVNLVSNEKEFESLQSVATSHCLDLHELKSDDWDAVETFLRDCARSR
ncbi:hypothetical protein FANTH_2973 [Fusarium anthophilum]|uniref:ATP-dependent RNA helicase n=1 Tax=Fusarium anthophilum TaxID=48485 RepID=A0A8H5E9G5_9HYPO|nr:hypothetical protein FANTH_2973 [Fusarium anthophilum]